MPQPQNRHPFRSSRARPCRHALSPLLPSSRRLSFPVSLHPLLHTHAPPGLYSSPCSSLNELGSLSFLLPRGPTLFKRFTVAMGVRLAETAIRRFPRLLFVLRPSLFVVDEAATRLDCAGDTLELELPPLLAARFLVVLRLPVFVLPLPELPFEAAALRVSLPLFGGISA